MSDFTVPCDSFEVDVAKDRDHYVFELADQGNRIEHPGLDRVIVRLPGNE